MNAYHHQPTLTFPNRIATQALASVAMSRVVQQDLEGMRRNAEREHERQGDLLAMGNAGLPHHVAIHAPMPGDVASSSMPGIRQTLGAFVGGIGRGGGAIGRGVASLFAGKGDDDESTAYGDGGGTGAASSSGGYPLIAQGVDHGADQRERMEAMELATRQLQRNEAARQEQEEIERQALANAMDVDHTPVAVQQNVQNILNLFQHNFTLNDQRQMHFTSNEFIQFLTQNFNQVNAQFNAGVDPRSIMYQAMQDAQRGVDQGLAMDEDGQLHITPPGRRAQVLGAKAKVKAKAKGKRPTGRTRAITAGPAPVSAALAVAAAPSGPGTLIPWQRENAVVATPSSASAAATPSSASATTRVASGGATLVRPKLGKTALAQARAKAKAKAKAALARLAESDE